MEWYRNLNAKPRLAIAFAGLLVLTFGIGLLGVYNLQQANSRMQVLYERDMRAVMAVDAVGIYKNDVARLDRDAILQIKNPQVVRADIETIKADFVKMNAAIANADRYIYSKEGIAALTEMKESVPAYERNVGTIIDAIQDDDPALAQARLLESLPFARKLTALVDRVRDVEEKLGAENFDNNQQSFYKTRYLIIGIIACALILGAVLSVYIANGFSRPLAQTVAVLEHVASGDLTASLEIDTKDEMGQMADALNQAVARLNKTMREVAESAAHASSSAQQLAAASESISAGAQEQAASLEETSASLEQITATVRNTADNAQQASQLASASRDSATQGKDVVASAVTAMSEIDAASAKISDIISTIDEIAFQTNLLAVNAAVEAARAGEEGRGFAVVATEVRSLAQRSASAAKEIKSLIQDSLRKVAAGSSLVNRSGDTLQSIVGSVKRVTDIVGEIAAAAREQSAGVDQVNTAMTQMDHVTQANSAQTEELSATAEALSEQSANLLRLIETFKLSRDESGSSVQFAFQASERSVANSGRVKSVSDRSAMKATKSKGVPSLAVPAVAAASGSDASFEDF